MSKSLFLLLALPLIISWCAKSTESKISFDGYSLSIKSSTATYEETPSENAYKVFVSKNDTWFTNSIIITKNNWDTKIPLSTIVEINIKKIEKKFKWFSSTDSTTLKFSCKERNIDGFLESLNVDSIDQNKTMFINQLFFMDWWYLYTLSTSTEKKAENKELKNGIKTIQCQK